MDPREPKIILERFYSRNVLLKAITLVVVGCIGSIVTMSDLIVPLLSFYGFLLLFLLSTFFYLTPERTNIILTVDEIQVFALPWDNICEINYRQENKRKDKNAFYEGKGL